MRRGTAESGDTDRAFSGGEIVKFAIGFPIHRNRRGIADTLDFERGPGAGSGDRECGAVLIGTDRAVAGGEEHIKQFAANFTVIGAFGDPKQAIEYLFGRGSKRELPLNATTLQKLAFEHMELFGFACGLIAL